MKANIKNKGGSPSVEPVSGAFQILGTYEGECADANITNNNGLDIPREVWENVFNSDDYKQAIQLGWYIGFLGHPDDPGCMDFRNACIVMTDGWIDDKGKVWGKFNLIDTPVGRVVKAFQDAGVVFGISVRGAGDIVANSVDPETFVFRGFDLVTFPAFPESIPTFSAIAASSDVATQQKYKKVCAAVKDNAKVIYDPATVDIIQSQFAKQSEEYKVLEERKSQLMKPTYSPDNTEEEIFDAELAEKKIASVTSLYLEQVAANTELSRQLSALRREHGASVKAADKKCKRIKAIANSQMEDVKAAHAIEVGKLNSKLTAAENFNLKYKQRVESASDEVAGKDSIIASLRTELAETVKKLSISERKASNLGARNRELQDQVTASRKLVGDYQDAYLQLYSSALGVNPIPNAKITASMSVDEVKAIIGSTSVSSLSSVFVEPDVVDFSDSDDEADGLVTI